MVKILKNMRTKEIIMSLVCVIFIVGQVYFDLLLPDYMSELTTLIKTSGTTEAILNIGLKMLGCTLISATFAIICGYLSSKVASGFSYTLRKKLYYHIIDLSKEEMQDFSIASLITRTTNDISQIQMIVSMGLQMLIKAPIMAIWGVIKILGKSWELSLVTAGFVIVICAIVLIVMGTCIPRFRKVQKMIDKINRVSRENLNGINVVHAFNAEEYQKEKFNQPSKEMMDIQMKNQKLFSLIQPTMNLGMSGLTLSIYWLGAVLINNIGTDVVERINMFSEILAFTTYATYIVMSFMMLVMIFMLIPQAQVSAERINEVLDKNIDIKEGKVEEGLEKGKLEFNNVSFYYPDSQEKALNNINFKIEQGQTLAIIGATGSGKSTLINLIPRLYDTSEGEVLIDGVNVKDYKFESLYNKIGFVTQKAILFSGTVKSNILFGESKNEFTDDDLNKAIDISQTREFIDKVPEKENYHIAQLARNVSGGQKQRISIARGIARNPEILVFDDSFSALDYRTDALVRKELNEKCKDVTKIIVAQRVGTIRHADKIIVLDRGEIVGMGTHDELMKNCAVYQEIAKSQLSNNEL